MHGLAFHSIHFASLNFFKIVARIYIYIYVHVCIEIASSPSADPTRSISISKRIEKSVVEILGISYRMVIGGGGRERKRIDVTARQ